MSSLPTPEIFIVCFSLVDRDSLDSVENFWMPKIRSVGKYIPIVLVGTQSDMRNATENGHISAEQGRKIAKSLGTEYYLECSAKTDMKIREVFEKTVHARIRHCKKKVNIIKRMFSR